MPRMTIQSAVDAVILTVERPTIRQLARCSTSHRGCRCHSAAALPPAPGRVNRPVDLVPGRQCGTGRPGRVRECGPAGAVAGAPIPGVRVSAWQIA
jgi:hypothetical protein